jgi:transposase-like protein
LIRFAHPFGAAYGSLSALRSGSRLTSKLDESLEKWRNRPLPEISHLLLDATYIKVRIDSSVRDCAMLVGIGIRRDNGKRMILGTSTALSENEVHWRTFLSSLRERGIGIPALITSDAHEDLKAALRATLNASPWQRCQFHLQQNAQAYVPKVSMRQQVANDIRYIFNARNRADAETPLNEIVEKYSQSAPDLARWMECAISEGLTIFAFPENIRRRLRTSNMCETLNSQIKSRTRVAGLFPNEASILRLVSAILMDISEEWESGKIYFPRSVTTNPNQQKNHWYPSVSLTEFTEKMLLRHQECVSRRNEEKFYWHGDCRPIYFYTHHLHRLLCHSPSGLVHLWDMEKTKIKPCRPANALTRAPEGCRSTKI